MHESAVRVSIDVLLEGIQVIGFDWTYLYVNDAACRQGRQPREDFIGRTMMACYPGIEETSLFAVLRRVMDGRRAERLLNEFVYPDGNRGWFDLRIEPVPNGICVLSIDVSDHWRLQAQLRQGQRMESIGRLAGGVAHDFNNVLTAILGYCELLLDRMAADSVATADLLEIKAAGERAGRLTRQLLAFSRKQILQPQVLDLNQIVADVDKMLSRVIGDDVRLEMRPAAAVASVKADPGQVEQVLLNLVVNARDAMALGGTIEVSTADVTMDDAFVRDHAGARPGRYVALAVRDTGTGIAPEILPHVFEPFFTTKDPGKGTGLGLATVYGIAKQSGGYVWIDTEPGVGTVVTTYWPAVDAPVPARTPATPTARLTSGSETILLAEDDARLRALMQRVLRESGYTVLEAADVAHALELGRDHHAPVDLLVSDIVMPSMNGPTLAQLLIQYQPSMKVLYVSGFPHTVIPGSPASGRRVSFLAKPFDPPTFVGAVRQCLDR